MHLRTFFAASAATTVIACALATPAAAQSTGSIEFEKEIVVTGARTSVQAVGGISAPDTSKAKAVLTQENISRQNPGQTILDTINQIPGVSFQNNDAYGSAGGTLNIRGFSSDRVSLTFDGVPLNDSGNYAIYSNQQIDPELISEVNVNLGTTDVDSPTASAAGGTVNLRTKTPDKDFGAMLSGSAGEFGFMRMFGKVEIGEFTSFGTTAFVSASRATNRVPFNGYGKIAKQQYNAKLYQPLGGTDFVSLAFHYNQNRNNFFGSVPLRIDPTRVVGSGSGNRFPITTDERFYKLNAPCTIAAGVAGVADVASTCGTEFDRRYNPSNTGNIRLSSKLTVASNLVLTVDSSYQWVKANGGGTVSAREGLRDINPSTTAVLNVPGYLGGNPFFGRDINGDGDALDQVTVLAPSQTGTRRFGLIAGLRWDLDDHHTLRVNYTLDHARHRQTGEVGMLAINGEPLDVFPSNGGLKDASGATLQKRDRLSYAILNQFSAEYRGEYFDNRLIVNAGVRLPFFKRDLTNYCYTSSAAGFVECFGGNATAQGNALTLNPYVVTTNATTGAIAVSGWATPQNRVLNYKKALPNIGFTLDVFDNASLFGNFSQGLSVPGTDNLYNAFYFPLNTDRARPKPETTDNFDLGARYRSGKIQAQVSAFYNQFQNRLATAYDPELNLTVYRNLGNVKKYGIDGSISYKPIDQLVFYVFGSLLKSEIKDNIAVGENANGNPVYVLTAGKREAGAPKYSFGGTVRGSVGPLELGITAKKTGARFIYDNNEAVYTGNFVPSGALACSNATTCVTPTAATSRTQVYGRMAPEYWLVNLDARVNLTAIGLNDKSFFQLNVYNLFDQLYVGGFGGGLNQSIGTYSATTGVATYGAAPNVQIGAPRTISGTLTIAF